MKSSSSIAFSFAALVATGVAMLGACGGSGTVTTEYVQAEGGISCGIGSQVCGGACTVVARDPQNCGACGTACKAGQVCSAGACGDSCGGGTLKCGSVCVDTKSDGANCGACGKTCGQGTVCSAGSCATNCQQNETMCGGDGGPAYCADTKHDNTNCGACGVTCGQGTVCSAGSCVTNCQQNESMCGGDGGPAYCADTKHDNTNCGGCGVTCGVLEACVQGVCTSACGGDGGVQTLCAGDGGPPFCANLQTDNANCGVCGTTCTNAQSCQLGVCKTLGVVPATCVELLATPTIWGHACTGFDLRKRTKSTLHFLGCVDSESCTFYCTYNVQTQTLSFGTAGSATLRAQVDPNNALGDTLTTGAYSCCTAQDPSGVCNAPDTANNGIPVNGAKALCNALGYLNGTYVRVSGTNSCPQAHAVDATGTNWSSDFQSSPAGYGAEYQCTGFQ